jgi:hypothetical protein
MLKQNADRAAVTFAVEFEPVVAMEKVSGAAEVVQRRLKTPHWGIGPGNYVFRDVVQRRIVVIDFRRVVVQTLGLDGWQKGLDDLISDVASVFQMLGLRRLKRIGFMTQAFLSLGMSHREMAELMFGSFLAPAENLQEVCGNADDVLLQLYGEESNMKLQLTVAPMTEDQAVRSVLSIANLEAFVEPKLIDTGVKDFRDRITTDCFYVQVDLSRTDVPDTEAALFLRQCLDTADKITEAAVQKLKSLRIRRGS